MTSIRIDALQYANWSRKIFEQMRAGGVDAVHVTIAYHESFREAVLNVEAWNEMFLRHADLIRPARSAADIRAARDEGRTAIIFGFQTAQPIEDDLGLLAIWHDLGLRVMQLTYNNQSLLATGCYEDDDTGLTRMGKKVVAEMNRLGILIDMSHSGERSTLETIAQSSRPIAITHANPHVWHAALRNKSDEVIRALTNAGGMIGFSLYPHHLRDGSACTLQSFCQMTADAASRYGAHHIGIGSDLCQDQPDSIVTWMRNGRWTRDLDYGEGSAAQAGFPPQPPWFENNTSFDTIAQGLRDVGFDAAEIAGIMGENWLRFWETAFEPES